MSLQYRHAKVLMGGFPFYVVQGMRNLKLGKIRMSGADLVDVSTVVENTAGVLSRVSSCDSYNCSRQGTFKNNAKD